MLLLDYDGTLVPLTPTPDESAPDVRLLHLLGEVGDHPRIDLHIVTGRPIATVQRWFRHLHATLWAEHGAACRRAGARRWRRLTSATAHDLDRIVSMFDTATRATPGALTEVKATAATWHYRRVDPGIRAARARLVRAAASALVANSRFELLDAHMALEVRPRGISKGAVVRTVRVSAPGTLFVAIGDDRTDLEMFAALPPGSFGIRVGDSPSASGHCLPNPAAVRRFIAWLTGIPIRSVDEVRPRIDRWLFERHALADVNRRNPPVAARR